MARFYIHLEDSDGFLADDVGHECVDREAARQEAVCAGADIIADDLKSGAPCVEVTLIVEDAAHEPLMRVPMTGYIKA